MSLRTRRVFHPLLPTDRPLLIKKEVVYAISVDFSRPCTVRGKNFKPPQITTFLFHFLWNWLAAYYSTYVYIIEIYHVGYVLLTSHMPPQTKFYIRHVRSGPCRLGILTWPARLADTGYKVKPIVHSVFRTRNRVEYNARLTGTPVQPPASISLVVCHVISAFEKALWIIHLSW